MPWIDKARAVLHAWYGGNETGNGIADIIYGNVNPVSTGQLRAIYPFRGATNRSCNEVR